MKQAKHTPAPWKTDGEKIVHVTGAPANIQVAVLSECRPIDAQLMAAAPELLSWLEKAAQMAEQQYNGGDDVPLNSAWVWLHNNIDQVIQKAKGQANETL